MRQLQRPSQREPTRPPPAKRAIEVVPREATDSRQGDSGAPGKLLLRVKDAALALSVGSDKVYGLLAAGAIRSVRIGSSRRIPVRELEAYVERLLADESDGIDGTASPH
jgi:excisionase family DNA binding protein